MVQLLCSSKGALTAVQRTLGCVWALKAGAGCHSSTASLKSNWEMQLSKGKKTKINLKLNWRGTRVKGLLVCQAGRKTYVITQIKMLTASWSVCAWGETLSLPHWSECIGGGLILGGSTLEWRIIDKEEKYRFKTKYPIGKARHEDSEEYPALPKGVNSIWKKSSKTIKSCLCLQKWGRTLPAHEAMQCNGRVAAVTGLGAASSCAARRKMEHCSTLMSTQMQ